MNAATLVEVVAGARVDDGFAPDTVDVPADQWLKAASAARNLLGCGFFDFLTAVEEPDGVGVVCHVACLEPFGHLALRTRLAPGERLVSLETVWAGAAWHERETAEMFGLVFTDDGGTPLARPGLLLPPGFEGHPLRKDFALESRDRPWPGDKDPV